MLDCLARRAERESWKDGENIQLKEVELPSLKVFLLPEEFCSDQESRPIPRQRKVLEQDCASLYIDAVEILGRGLP